MTVLRENVDGRLGRDGSLGTGGKVHFLDSQPLEKVCARLVGTECRVAGSILCVKLPSRYRVLTVSDVMPGGPVLIIFRESVVTASP